MNKTLLLTGISLALGISARAQGVIADWTFQTSLPTTAGPVSPEVGAGSASGSHAGAAVYSTPAGNGSSHSYSANTWAAGDYWQFQVNATGFTGIQLSFDQISSGTGPGAFQLEYSTDGSSFNNFGSPYSVLANATPTIWGATTPVPASSYSFDLSSITALDNASTLYFRLVESGTATPSGGTVASGGTDRVDNVVVSTVPEPSMLALLGMGGATVLGWTRRGRK